MEKAELLKIIGKRIQEIRNSKEYSQVDLAGKIEGVFDTTNVSRIESGRTNPTIYTLHRIAEALEVSLSELLNIEDCETNI
ncbi:helix-turn-helix transcriptional regulator [Olleya sp. AS48]|uniref:helix-turn-helix domain-containing protein n=1 Tax=Olleya sp. AS48 TaxID=3135774 RepID=UPI003179BA42